MWSGDGGGVRHRPALESGENGAEQERRGSKSNSDVQRQIVLVDLVVLVF